MVQLTYKEALQALIEKRDFSYTEMMDVMQQVMSGQLTPAQIAGLLIGLRVKGETVEEIAAAAEVMRNLSTKVNIQDTSHLVDTCGTGGDGIQTFNVSTASAFVAAAAGACVAKHGGRSVSSTCGSIDVLEALSVNINQTPEQVALSIKETGVGFMFAPNHHSAMKYAAPVRRELGIRTIFNLLGPLTNPAGAKRQVMGVFHRDLTTLLAGALKQLGSEHVMVVHGADGMDEISFTGETYIAELKGGEITQYTINPMQFGLAIHDLKSIQVKNAEESKEMVLDVLSGKESSARDIVLMNAGAAIYVAGITDDLTAGIEAAKKAIDSGDAMRKLKELQTRSIPV